jgi:hypothetical protein
MVRAQLREATVKAIGLEAIRDIGDFLARGITPSVIVIDGSELNDPARRQVVAELARVVPVAVVDSRTTPAPVVPGTDVLWRPVCVQEIVSRVLEKLNRKT